ncbi:MAG: calcium-translocating P-type ATPase, PMCA-type [Clostridiales bacterium]|jgi:calcium-translocating P-type ATPase|nr:calcium-translocating P-type ATPase, PMCA-type [Clostridiales bacterium]
MDTEANSTFKGLTDKEVIESRLSRGSNLLSEVKPESFRDKLIGNFGDPMIKILCVALIINVVFAFLGKTHWYESVGIALAVLIATFVSTFSEYRNENAFQKLQDEASRIKCKVYRNGIITEIPIDDVVADDLVLLQSGDKIPADGAIISGSIKVDQSVLNGESKEAEKKAAPADYENPETVDFLDFHNVFRGAIVCSGNAVMKAASVGDSTLYGKIAGDLQRTEDRDSPLKVKLSDLAEGISRFGYIGGVAIAAAFMFVQVIMNHHAGWQIAQDAVNAVILAVIIIVMAVPEGLPLMIAIVSALNMGKMLKDNVLVRKIAGIETAGSLNILFSDKTGTITKGRLEAVVFADGEAREYNSFEALPEACAKLLALSIRHNTSALLTTDESGNPRPIGGNATERAILGFIVGKDKPASITVADSVPFNSENKYSLASVKGDYECTLIKGAPEKILSRCTGYYDGSGNIQDFAGKIADVEAVIDRLAERAIRVLAFAVSKEPITEGRLPSGGCALVGVVGIRDEVRPESITAIAEVKRAGVQVVMITGDRKDTATAIAREAGLLTDDGDVALTSEDLRDMTDEQIAEILPKIRVISRALPSDKSRLVKIAQDKNLVVGMTGDGVNDSPALKKADVGFAMGGGTEVAKEAGDIVILDDNFNSIDKAILYGRTIFNSIRKFIIFQLTINVTAVLVSFASPLLGMENPLSITQILWINLVMDTLAALAFGGEPALPRFMHEAPKRRDEPIVSGYMWSAILTGAVFTFIMSMLFLFSKTFDSAFRGGAEDMRYVLTGYFVFFIFAAVFNSFNARTDRLNLFDNIGKNPGFLRIIGLIALVQIIMTYLGGAVLRCYGLNPLEWAVALGSAALIIPVDLIRKAVTAQGKRR